MSHTLRLGVIIPSSNTTVEYEFTNILRNSNLTVHFARIPLTNVTIEDLRIMENNTETAAKLLSDADMDIIIYACTTGSLFKGLGHDLEIENRIKNVTGIPAIATAGAVVRALKKLKAKKISIGTPYTSTITDKEIAFLIDNGFDVIKSKCLGIVDNRNIGRLLSKDAYALGIDVSSFEADAIFISCTNFRTFEAIEDLERIVKKPVISSNSATLWNALKVLGQSLPLPLGKLFQQNY